MARGGSQLRLLLWKDYLIRKRNFITLAGILWASGILMGFYIVRRNVDNQDFPTCQFAARALPSAGMLPFLQSFICSVGNECEPMDKFEEIPAYEKAKFSQLQRQFVPLLNESVLELASSMPDAVKMLATLANIADEPTFNDFTKNGLRVADLFVNPLRVKRYVTSHMELGEDEAQSLMTSEISFQGLLKGDVDRCSPDSISHTLVIKNREHLNSIVKKLCKLTPEHLMGMFKDLMYEINFSKYVKMLGNMYYKLSGDDRINQLGDFLTAFLRMTRLSNFLPPELTSLFRRNSEFSYLKLNMIQKFVDLFQPTFGDTKEFQSIKEFADTAVIGVQYLAKMFGNQSNNDTTGDITDLVASNIGAKLDVNEGLDTITKVLSNAADAIENMNDEKTNIDPYNVLTQITKMVYKFLPNNYQHDVLFYSTLISKLMESAHHVININMHLEEIAYNTSLGHPKAIQILKDLPPHIVGKSFEALVSPERTQILTSKLNSPGQMFCDLSKIQNFFLITKSEAESAKKLFCSDAWKNYVIDLVNTFGVFVVKNNINDMAGLLIQETLGKDTSSQLYPIEKDFQILRNFTSALMTMEAEDRPVYNWKKLLGVVEDSKLIKVVREKVHLGKLILISVHGALAKEILKQNVILQYKITPVLLDATTLVTAFNEQMDITPPTVPQGLKTNYGDIVKTILLTALNEQKAYKSLSTYCEDILCHGGDNAAMYLEFAPESDIEKLASALCNASVIIEQGLRNDSLVAKAIAKISGSTHTILQEVNWTRLINNIQKLYMNLEKDYPYLFEFSTYEMDNDTQQFVHTLYKRAKDHWFSVKNMQKGLHLSVKFGFRFLDMLDHGIFNMTNEHWLKMKFVMSSSIGPLSVLDDTVKLVTALFTNSFYEYPSDFPSITAESMRKIITNVPDLIVDSVDIMVDDNTDLEAVISLVNSEPGWPCAATSLAELLPLRAPAQTAVRALEHLLCSEHAVKDEWGKYLDGRKATINKTLTWNNTEFEPHLFLKFSGTFDALVNDTVAVKEVLQYILNSDASKDHIGLKAAWEYAIKAFNTTERNTIMSKFIHKLDTVVNSIAVSPIQGTVSLNSVWDKYMKCSNSSDVCRATARATWVYTLKTMSIIFDNVASDLAMYFTEANGPDSNVLQVLGFTKDTTLYMLYDRLPEFVAVLLNSYFDYGFMSQIRRASQTQFWDCEAVVSALVPAPEGSLRAPDIERVKPYVCPSFIYWLSLPRGENVLFNLVAKPQYFFYTMQVENTTSRFEDAFTKATNLSDYLTKLAKENKTEIANEIKLTNIEDNLAYFIDKVLNYKLNMTDRLYKQFSDINKKQIISNVYLTKIVAMVNKLATALNNITIDENTDLSANEVEKLNADLKIIRNIFRRKAIDAIAIHYDILTDVLWTNDDDYALVDAMGTMCNNLKENDESKTILVKEVRTSTQLCAKNYSYIFGLVQDGVKDDFKDARQSLMDFVDALQNDEEANVTDIFAFLNTREQQVLSLQHSIKYSYDLGLPLYLKFLHSNLRSYNVIITFLSGGNWWKDLRDLYDGPFATKFFGILEQSFEIAHDFLNNLDGIHLVRLIRDSQQNDSSTFCARNLTLTDYIPDSTGALAELNAQICSTDMDELFKEIPPLLYASQGYGNDLTVSKTIDYRSLDEDISTTTANLNLINDGPSDPRRPLWITDEKLALFRRDVVHVVSKETITKMVFGVMGNMIDAGTLFLNNSQCLACSDMTSWLKQLNLQLFKKQEYDSLLCHLDTLTLDEVYRTLKTDFHWDMFIREIISSRNYTKLELNKSLNQFVSLVEALLLEDMAAPRTKLAACLAHNLTSDVFGYTSLAMSVGARAARLLRAQAPHVHEVQGVRQLPYLARLHAHVAHNLPVWRPLRDYLATTLADPMKEVLKDDELLMDIEHAQLNLNEVHRGGKLEEQLLLHTNSWPDICREHDCAHIRAVLVDSLNLTHIDTDLAGLQSSEFWQLSFARDILQHVEALVSHAARLAGAAGALGVRRAAAGTLAGALGVRRAAAGTLAGALGVRRAAAGTLAGALGVRRAAAGTLAGALGVRRAAAGTLAGALGVRRAAAGTLAGALGVRRAAAGTLAGALGVQRAAAGTLAGALDLARNLLADDTFHTVIYSLKGLIEEVGPLVKGTPLSEDLDAITSGLNIFYQFKTYLVEEVDLKLQVSRLFPEPEALEAALAALGINNTNFWSLAAPRIHAGYIHLKPVLTPKEPNSQISSYVCDMDAMSTVLLPSTDSVPTVQVTLEDVLAATVDQFCGLSDDRGKEVLMVLMKHMDMKIIIDKVKEQLLDMVYSASELTPSEGSLVVARFPRMAALLPSLQDSLGGALETLGQEPLFRSLQDFSSVGSLFSSGEFLAAAGTMMCGKPFSGTTPRLVRSIISAPDQTTAPDQRQLDALPTEFCRSMYKDVISMEGGKILWSFVKPLIMGRILYTPPHPAVTRLVRQANSSFAGMISMAGLVQSFSSAFPSLESMSSHRRGLQALQQLVAAPGMDAVRNMLLGDQELDLNIDVEGLFHKVGDLKGIGSLLSKASSLLQCVNLDRFRAVRDEHELMLEAARLTAINEFSAGVVFLNVESLDSLTDVRYKIRMDIENAPTTARIKPFLWTPGPESSFIENMRYFRGFVQIQDLLDKAVVQLAAIESSRSKRESVDTDYAVYTQQEPYPCYRKDFFQASLYESQAMLAAFFFSLLFTVTSVVRFIVVDKETGNTMLMSVMGVNLAWVSLSWFVCSLAEMAATMAAVTAIIRWGEILPRTDPTLVFALLMIFGLAVLSFCYMMSKLFSSASFGAVCAGIAYLVSFMPIVLVLSLEAVMARLYKLLVCLSMSSCVCYAFLLITRGEARGAGAGWRDVWAAPPDDLSVAAAAGMMLLDAALYLAIGYLIDRKFGIKSIRGSITVSTRADEKASVSIVNVSKVYGEGSRRHKLALDNVSLDLHKGQITALLGHNGAGKTTLIKIITGMLAPSKGNVVIRTEPGGGGGGGGGVSLGVCPQRDVLFEYMTAREHVALYAQLKSGLTLDDVREEVDSMVSVLALGALCSRPAAHLSGGTRRRLCVALAFVARPALVVLDEPTAGVDPAARRDIWSVIEALKAERTVLVTTHHMDEAELLSDHIVIMHKGQIHTTGSPIEIKRTLGSGYKLKVYLPDRQPDWQHTTEEKAKEILALVRDVVKNASVVDVASAHIEINLPFYDADGASNNFAQVCTCLEEAQPRLGFRSFEMDCSTLEQVFFDICARADSQDQHHVEELPSKSASNSSLRSLDESLALVEGGSARRGARAQQFLALLRARMLHHVRNKWLLFMLIVLPTLFVTLAMAFSTIRPPPDNEVTLKLAEDLYPATTEYIVSNPSIYSEWIDPTFARRVMDQLTLDKVVRNWTDKDTPACQCAVTRLECTPATTAPSDTLLSLPDVGALNTWLVNSHDIYIEKRYGGFTSALAKNKTNIIAWYNNKGYHALPSYLSGVSNAVLRAAAGTHRSITTYSHPLKISKEQISKNTVYQHVADAGIAVLVLVAFSLVSAGGAVYLVSARARQEKRLQLLCGVSPALYWAAAMAWDLMIICINIAITAIVMWSFGFPVFVERDNLPAICLLMLLYGFACGSMIHCCEKLFREASLANMMLFTGNSFLGLSGIVLLLILDIISESDATDEARRILHKVFLLSPQFALGDGMLEIAKNTIQGQVLNRFGMDTYRSPLHSSLIALHYAYLAAVGCACAALNLAIEYGYLQWLRDRMTPGAVYAACGERVTAEPADVAAERRAAAAADPPAPLALSTIGNINRGFVHTEGKNNSLTRTVVAGRAAACLHLGKAYGTRVAVRALSLTIPQGKCTALLGENGAGKSTTFGMLTGAVRPTRGHVRLAGGASRHLARGLVSYCPQSNAVDPLLTVRETLALYCQLRGISGPHQVIERTLEMFDIGRYGDVRCAALSGGNQRKLCTALAFMGRAPLVLLDEPTSGMDPVSRRVVCAGAARAAAAGRAVLLSTHALPDARALADKLALLRAGELAAVAPRHDLHRFGGGYVVACRTREARDAWRRVRSEAPHAVLRVMHACSLHFMLPATYTVEGKEARCVLSAVFALVARLQAAGHIDDCTINQSSLEQMFSRQEDGEPRPTEELDSVTAL